MEDTIVCGWCAEEILIEHDYAAEVCCGVRSCGRTAYHQSCLEDHLRKQGLPGDRMAGYPCPRGLGKKATCEPCRGRVDSTHKKIPSKKKKKKAAVAPLPAPKLLGPRAKGAQSVPAPGQSSAAAKAASRLASQLSSKPAPVRGAVPPSGARLAAAPTPSDKQTKTQMLEMVALLRKEIKIGNKAQPGDGTAAGSAGAAARLGAAPTPGQGAAARMGFGKNARVAPVFIPGWEADDFSLQHRGGPSRAPAAPPARPSHFNWVEQQAAFPTLGNAAQVTNANINAVNYGFDDGNKPGGAAKQAVTAINALNPGDEAGFVSNLERYNMLLGLSREDSDDEGSSSLDLGSATETKSSSADSVTQGLPSPTVDATAALDFAAIPDEILAYALQYGVEEAGLPAEYAAYVQQVAEAFGELWQEGGADPVAQPQWTAEQQAEADLAEYLAAERIVLENERALEVGGGGQPLPAMSPVHHQLQLVAPAAAAPQLPAAVAAPPPAMPVINDFLPNPPVNAIGIPVPLPAVGAATMPPPVSFHAAPPQLQAPAVVPAVTPWPAPSQPFNMFTASPQPSFPIPVPIFADEAPAIPAAVKGFGAQVPVYAALQEQREEEEVDVDVDDLLALCLA